MSTRKHAKSWSLLASGVVGALVVPLSWPAQAAEVDLEASMHATAAFPRAGGYAEYESEDGGREFDIFISGVAGLAGKQLTVRVHGAVVGRMRVGSGGRAHLDRRSGVPEMSAGYVVRVRTPGGRLVTAGTLYRDPDH